MLGRPASELQVAGGDPLPQSLQGDAAIDVSQVLARFWKPILVSMVVGALSALVVSIVRPAVYASHAALQIGRMPEVGVPIDGRMSGVGVPIETTEMLIERVKQKYQIGRNGSFPRLRDAQPNRRIGFVVLLTSYGVDASQARDFMTQVVNEVIADHEASLDQVLGMLRQRLGVIDNELRDLRRQVTTLSRQAENISARDMTSGVLVAMQHIAMQHNGLLSEVKDLERERFQILSNISGTTGSKLMTAPTFSSAPTGFGSVVYAAIGALIGLVLAGLAIVAFCFLRVRQNF